MSSVKVEVKENSIVIEIPINKRTSKSGKSLVLASTDGNKATDASYNGKQIVVGANVYVPVD